jgi:hypothetical protein
MKSVIKGRSKQMSELAREPEPRLFESRSRSGNTSFGSTTLDISDSCGIVNLSASTASALPKTPLTFKVMFVLHQQ